MLVLSSKVDYGLVLLAFLAKNNEDQPIPLRFIAKSQRLPFKYLSVIATALKRAGIITTKEGARGGVYLVKKPAQITVGEVIAALDGEIGYTKCTNYSGKCRSEKVCCLRLGWMGLKNELVNFLSQKTLADLVLEHDLKERRDIIPSHIGV